MARSKRKHPVFSITVSGHRKGEKQDKRKWNRLYRRRCHIIILDLEAAEDGWFPLLRELSDVWTGRKDGKVWHKNPSSKSMRK